MHYQDINEILAKGVKIENMSPEYAKEISSANAYLLNRTGRKPAWMDEFLDSNRCKLVETICRATSSTQGISSLQGYSEGYFNEIIQNANDLHCADTIHIKAERLGSNCRLDCKYSDNGFELSNIYAFLNREMSDKVDDESQTGMFGVGIKSFFKFVDRLRIESNVTFDFSVNRKNSENTVCGTAAINSEWFDHNTTLTISYDSELESSFNTAKLTALIDYLCGYRDIDVLEYLLTGTDSEIVFDIRSLIFMRLNARAKKSISKLEFGGSAHTVSISCKEESRVQTLTVGDATWKTGVLKLSIFVDQIPEFEKCYIVFSRGSISVAFPVADYSSENNRMYSTYYLKKDVQEQLLPIGMLIDSKYANIHRNDVADSEEKINAVYDKLRNFMKDLYGFMCSEQAANLTCADAISDVFHSIIARYLMEDGRNFKESPLRDAYFDNAFLPKKIHERARAYVIVHKQKEAYDSASYQEGDIVQELRENYFDFVERKKAYDLHDLMADPGTIYGVKKIYALLSDPGNTISRDNWRAAAQITNYFASVADFLTFAISRERREELYVTDAEIDNWLLKLRDEVGKYYDPKMFLKLIGRYHLNTAIAYDGAIRQTNLSFKDYLFNGILASSNGLLSQYQNQFYDEKYSNLKQELLQKRYTDPGNKKNIYMIRCIRPNGRSVTGWDGTYDYYELNAPANASEKLSEPQLLLERMATDEKFSGLWMSAAGPRLFESSAKGMWRRDYQFKNYEIDEQQIIQLSCIKNIRLNSFVDFINAVKYRCMLRDKLRNYIHITCIEESITTKEINEKVLPVMVEIPEGDNKKIVLDEFAPSDIKIQSIQENSNNEMPVENEEVVFKITGYHVHLYRFLSNTRRKILAYFGNGRCAVKTDASRKYREVAGYNSADKNIYIFYDNIPGDLQQAVTSVLNEIGISTKNLELLEGYIHNDNVAKTMNYMSRRRNLAKVKKKLVLDWADFSVNDMDTIYDTEILYRLLTARGSYDIFCPICSDIPMETFDYGEDTKKKHSRKIILMENENPDTNKEIPYIITVACSYCCQRLRSTLIKSEFDGRNLILTTQVSHGLHEKTRRKLQIELSPFNIEVMRKFKVMVDCKIKLDT